MTWLYSLLFAGIVFTNNNGQAANQVDQSVRIDDITAAIVQDEIEKFEQTYPFNANGRVELSNVNGPVLIEAWDRGEVRVEATKIADSKETLADVEIVVNASPDHLKIETDYKGWHSNRDSGWKQNRKVEVQYRLSVPRTAILNEIETVNGSVKVSNFTNITKVSAVNGNVTAVNLRGTANLSTVNGEVNADFDRAESGTRISLSTVNGRVNLVLPSDINATIKADSLNGAISNEYGLPVSKGEYVGRNLHGRLGNGEVQIRLNSVNGGLSIGRKKDGKSLSPSQNLLPQDSDTDDDDDEGLSSDRTVVNTAKVNREVIRAMKASRRATAAAIKDSTKAIVKIKPEMDKIDLKELEDLKVEIDEKELQSKINEAMEKQAEALEKYRDAVWSAPGPPTIEKRSNTFPVKGIPMVTVDAKGCNVRVRGWDKQEVRYVLTEIASNHGDKHVPVKEIVNESSVSLTVSNQVDSPGFWGHSSNMRLEVFVPKKSNLKVTTDGEIRLDGVSGEMELNGKEQSIDVRDSSGTLRLRSDEGQVRVVGFKGDVESVTKENIVFLEGDFNKLSVRATESSVTLIAGKGFNAELTGEAEVFADGVELVRESSTSLRVGTGGPQYSFELTDGKLIVKSTASLETY
jgi:hypothetical protein